MYFAVKKINELVVTSNKLRNNLAGLVTSGLRPDLVRGPPVLPRWPILFMELDVPESEVGEPRSIQTQLYLK
jgi:hypothetical protein